MWAYIVTPKPKRESKGKLFLIFFPPVKEFLPCTDKYKVDSE